MSHDVVRVRAPAKVNLSLSILARETTGYHQIETLFCALELADTLILRAVPQGLSLEVEGAELGPPQENLVHRAASAFYQAAGLAPAVHIRLEKRIPIGAGLGGGSSDAAATLRGLNRLHGHPLDHETLLRLAASLGSDVPFFLAGSPLALAWGRGERLLALPPLPPAPTLVAMPDFSIRTADAYHALAQHRAASATPVGPRLLRLDDLCTWEAIAANAANDFEPVIFARYPELAAIRESLAESRPRLALLAGSGAALFAIFHDEDQAAAAARALRARFPTLRLFETRTARALPEPVADPRGPDART